MDYKKCVILPPSPQRKIPSPSQFIDIHHNGCERDGARYQYDLKPDIFDPFGTSPPQIFMLKLKERLGMHSMGQHKDAVKMKDFMRNSE
jgi:hypothetical protein